MNIVGLYTSHCGSLVGIGIGSRIGGPWMDMGHSESQWRWWHVYTVCIDRFSVTRAVKVAVNNGNSTFFAIPSAGEPERIPKIFQNISELFWMFCFSFVSHLQANEQNETGVFLFY